MKHTEIEAIFTAKVAEYIQQGYILNLTTMSGSQGEIGSVDLRKGGEVLRILLESKREYDRETHLEREMVVLTVGRWNEFVPDDAPFESMGATIWNNRLETIEQRRFYQINRRRDFYTEDIEAYDEMLRKQYDRCVARGGYIRLEDRQLPDYARKIAKRYIKRVTGKDRVSGKNIKVYKSEIRGRVAYNINYFGQTYCIH